MFKSKMPGKGPHEGDAIELKATVVQVKTMADGGYRIQLDVGENDFVPVMALMPAVRKVFFQVKFLGTTE